MRHPAARESAAEGMRGVVCHGLDCGGGERLPMLRKPFV